MSARKILIADDQPHILRVIRIGLTREGYEVDVAADGREAFEKLSAQPYDVLITDIQMPRMDGRALCAAIHEADISPRPFTLVVTARAESQFRSWVDDYPDTELIEKPVSLRWLTARIEDYFAQRSASESAG